MKSALWPVHPHPLPDELLSSWMIRVARANGYKVHNFYAEFYGRERQIWNRDIDHHAPAWLQDALASRTGTSRERISQTTLRALESCAFEMFNETGVTRWVLPLGIFHRTRRAYGQQFCPVCLAQDPEPYLRRSWRLALSVICTHHGVLLRDRCGTCGHPLAPHRTDMAARGGFPERTTMARCHQCRTKLSDLFTHAEAGDVQIQIQIDGILCDGFATMGVNKPVYAPLFFDGLRRMMRIIPRVQSVERWMGFEFATGAQRLDLLRHAMQLLVDWPHAFLRECAQLPHAYTTLCSDGGVIPYWLDAVLRWHVFQGRALISRAEAVAISDAVQRMEPSGAVASRARALFGRDIGRLLPALPAVSDDVADLLVASLDQEITQAPLRKRYLLLRDKVMFVAARCLHLRGTQLAVMTIHDIGDGAGDEFSFWGRVEATDAAYGMLRWYRRLVLPHLALKDTVVLFPAHDGKPMGANGIGMRFERAVVAGGLRLAIPSWGQWAIVKSNEFDQGGIISLLTNDVGDPERLGDNDIDDERF